MSSVFVDANGILMVDYLQKGHAINGKYYASFLRHLGENIKVKRRGKLSKCVLFHQDNVTLTRLSLIGCHL